MHTLIIQRLIKKQNIMILKSDKKKPTWLMVDVKYKRKLMKIITLKELKSEKKLSKMRVVQKGNRLSITEVEKKIGNIFYL